MLARILLTLALLPFVFLGAAPASAVDQGTSTTAQPRDIRVATYNIRAGMPFGDFTRAVTAIRERADVVGLQEMNSNKKRYWLTRSERWEYFRAPDFQQNPVIYDRLKFVFVSGSGPVIARSRDLRGELGDQDDKKDSKATVVRLVERQTGQRVSFVNVHLVHGAVRAGRPWPGRPRTFGLYADQVRGLRDVVRREQRWGRVFVTGDFNVGYVPDARWQLPKLPHATFTGLGLRSMWRGSDYLDAPYGTRNDALIDGVWSEQAPVGSRILRRLRWSDHLPAVATYRLPAVPGHVPARAPISFGDALVHEGTGVDVVLRLPVYGELGDGSVTPVVFDYYNLDEQDVGPPALVRTQDPYVSWVEMVVHGDSEQEPFRAAVSIRLVDPVGVTLIRRNLYASGTVRDDD